MRILVDQNKCIGAGNCVLNAPTYFAQEDDSGLVMLLQPAPAETDEETVRQAIELCPARAISLAD